MRATSGDIVRAVRGPILLIVLGLLFVGEYWGQVPFYKTWPVLLIAYGALKLLEQVAPDSGSTTAGGSL